MNIPLKKESLPFLFIFFFQGAFYAQTTSPLPAIKEASSFSDSQIGTGFLCVGIGLLLGLALFGKISSRIESKTTLKWAGLGMLLWAPCLSFGLSSTVLNIFGLLFGVTLGIYQGSRNVQGILYERQCGRNVMGLLYAAHGLGNIAGSVMTSFLMGVLGASLFCRFILFFVVFGVVGFWACRYLISDSASTTSQQGKTTPSKSKMPLLIFVFGIMSLGAMDLEAMVGSWGTILLSQSKGAPASLSSLSYAATALGLLISSLACDWLRKRIGSCCIIAFGTLLAWGGLVFAVYVPSPAMTLLGFFCIGLGVAPVSPVLMSAIGSLPGVNIAHASVILSWIGNAGFLLLPGAQGFLAEHFSIELAFLSSILVSLVTLLGSFSLRGKR